MKIIFEIKPKAKRISLLEILEDIKAQAYYDGEFQADRRRMIDKIDYYLSLLDDFVIVKGKPFRPKRKND